MSFYTPLFYAAKANKDLRIVRCLVSNGANVNKKVYDELTPLHASASKGVLSIIRYLVEQNADINSLDSKGETPLYLFNKLKNKNEILKLIKI